MTRDLDRPMPLGVLHLARPTAHHDNVGVHTCVRARR